MTPDDVDWHTVLDTRLLHLTGLTAGISDSSLAIIHQARARARAADLPVSFDVNYRHHLWDPKQAAEAVAALAQDVELLFCRAEDAALLFGIEGDPHNCVKQLQDLTNARHLFMTRGASGFVGSVDGAPLERPAAGATIVDRLGAGDAFAAGILHGWLDGDLRGGADVAPLLAAVALGQRGEALTLSREDLGRLLQPPGPELDR
jgi:2-dehydro-3-deoxygluconokinase